MSYSPGAFESAIKHLLSELPNGWTGQVIIDIGTDDIRVRPHESGISIKRERLATPKRHAVA